MSSQKIKTSHTDVVIIGAGPSGLMAACWLARTGTPFRIIDKRSNKVYSGQADGLQARTLEVFDSFGFGNRALKEANPISEMCFWSPDANGLLVRSARAYDAIPGLSRFTEMVLHQGRIELWFLDLIEKWLGGKSEVERSKLPLRLDVDEKEEYAVSLLVKDITAENSKADSAATGANEIANGLFRQFDGDQDKFYEELKNKEDVSDYENIKCKYVIGSDGAHLWVRKQLGITMEGETTDHIWGVVDMIPSTDFPDIRNRCAIHLSDSGSVMVIPREHGLVRLYTQLKDVARDSSQKQASEFGLNVTDAKIATAGRVDRSKITPDLILNTARKIMHPYKMEFLDIEWYTGYQIGQRVSDSFSAHNNRVFITGDACHTHSPKAGQGMNVSMMDTYNLAWKIAYVCKGLAKPDILSTYQVERKQVAHDLIDFDKKLSSLFSLKPMALSGAGEGVDMDEFHSAFKLGLYFALGVNVDYNSLLSLKSDPKGSSLENDLTSFASNIPVGKRLSSTTIVAQLDASVHQVANYLPSDGRWRVVVFPGDIKVEAHRDALKEAAEYFESKTGFIRKFTPQSCNWNAVFDILTIHRNERESVELTDFPIFARPIDSHGRLDYYKLFSGVGETYHQGKYDAFKHYGIQDKGCAVLVRPDGYVSAVTEISQAGLKEMESLLDGALIAQKSEVKSEKPRLVLPWREPILAV